MHRCRGSVEKARLDARLQACACWFGASSNACAWEAFPRHARCALQEREVHPGLDKPRGRPAQCSLQPTAPLALGLGSPCLLSPALPLPRA